jgi:Cu(I)/Ag(I) efflux system membrane fusion protein
VVKSINIAEGQYVDAGQALFELADDSRLWVEAQVNPDEIESLKTGMPSKIIIPDAGDVTINSSISFINPSLEQGSYVTLIRSNIENPNKKLYPGMLALMQIPSEKNRCIIVPATAVISDKNASLVWIQNMDGSFSARNITVGMQSDDTVQILSGLTESDYVVTTGAYLLNSEFILRGGSVGVENEEMISKAD